VFSRRTPHPVALNESTEPESCQMANIFSFFRWASSDLCLCDSFTIAAVLQCTSHHFFTEVVELHVNGTFAKAAAGVLVLQSGLRGVHIDCSQRKGENYITAHGLYYYS